MVEGCYFPPIKSSNQTGLRSQLVNDNSRKVALQARAFTRALFEGH